MNMERNGAPVERMENTNKGKDSSQHVKSDFMNYELLPVFITSTGIRIIIKTQISSRLMKQCINL